MENCFKPESGSRDGVPKVGILITDGKSQDDVIPPAESLRANGVELFAIGEDVKTHIQYTNTYICSMLTSLTKHFRPDKVNKNVWSISIKSKTFILK